MKYQVRTAVALAVLSAFAFSSGSGFLPSYAYAAQTQQKDKKPPQPTKPKSEEPPDQDNQRPIVLNADLVMLDVTVLDPSSKPVTNLTEDKFQVFEDKVQQKIEVFSRDQVPVSLVFTIDTSGSMRAKLDTVIKASVNLVKESRPDDELAVIEFKEKPELLTEFTSDVNDVIDTLQGFVASSQTAMLDALYLAADYAQKDGKNRRKAVIVVTDGLDKDSYYKFSEVVSHLRELDVQVYLIGFTNDLSKDGAWVFKKSEKENAENLLTRLATETGGKAFFPKELAEVHQIAQQISSDLRTQYSIGYYSTNSKRDGTFRAVKVMVNDPSRRLGVRTRNGYTAAREGEPNKTKSSPQ